MHKFTSFIKWILVITLPLMFISSSIAICFNCEALYHFGYVKYDVVRETGFDLDQLDDITHEIITYFNDTKSNKDLSVIVTKNHREVELFTEREIIHMKDVKGLVQLDYTILRITLIINILIIALLLFKKEYKKLSFGLIGGDISSLSLMAIIGIASLIDFYSIFILFHQISFDNDYWLLEWTDALILLFPEGFWFDCLFTVIGIIVFLIIIFGVFGIILRKKSHLNT